MTPKAYFITSFSRLLCLVSFITGCEDQTDNLMRVHLPGPCTLSLAIINTISHQSGIVTRTKSTFAPYIIQGSSDCSWPATGPLLPCNLPEELEIEGLKIVFSGYLYEDLPGANAIGVPFEFTEILVED